jgi:Flp pilus assembly protein TadD
MRNRPFLIILFATVATLAGRSQSPAWSTYVPRPLPFTLEGQVQAGEALQPVAHAVVRLYREADLLKECVTGAAGRFQFLGVPVGRYRITVRGEGFQRAEETVELAGRGGTIQRLEIRLRPEERAAAGLGSPTVSVETLQLPKKARQEFDRGQEDLRKGKFANAAGHFRRALEIQPAFPQAWLELGVALRGGGDAAGAERALRECLRLDPPSLRARLNLAELCAATGRGEEARGLLDETVALHPAEPDPHQDLGKLHFLAGRLEEAEAEWKKAAALPRARPEIHLLLARLYLQRRQVAAMAAELEEYLQQDPGGPYADQVRATLASIRRQEEGQ